MKSKIALIGFRATGKSLVGQLLARRLGWSFVDMDDQIVNALGMSIDAWVKLNGWESFRHQESLVLASLAQQSHLVVATGGGVILDAGNRALLQKEFHVVWLQADRQTILSRILGDTRTAAYRPPLTELPLESEIETVLSERIPLYRETAHHCVEVDRLPPEEIMWAILKSVPSVDDSRR
jgi:shikimate kinase